MGNRQSSLQEEIRSRNEALRRWETQEQMLEDRRRRIRQLDQLGEDRRQERQREQERRHRQREKANYLVEDIKYLIRSCEIIIASLTEENCSIDFDLGVTTNLYQFVRVSVSKLNDHQSRLDLLNNLASRLNKLKDLDPNITCDNLYLHHMNNIELVTTIASDSCKLFHKDCYNKKLYDSEYCYDHLNKELEECCICFNEKKLTTTPCLHHVCYDCRSKISSCPICRYEIGKVISVVESCHKIDNELYQKIINIIQLIRSLN